MTTLSRPGFGESFSTFARIGLLSFGGPAGQIALMHRTLVEEKKWLDEERFLHALNYCMLLPGPEAMQLATYAGWLFHGVRGGLMAGILFLLPGAALITLLSALYLAAGETSLAQGLLFGLKAAVLAVVLEAMVKVSKRALKGPGMVALAVAAFVLLALFGLPFPLVVIGAALLGATVHALGSGGRLDDGRAAATSDLPDWARPSLRRFLATSTVWLALWLVPLLALNALLGRGHVLTQEASFFSVMAAVTFGGAYAVLAYVAQQAVEVYGWLRPDEMLTGLGLAETTPGPLILVLVFVGFLGSARFAGIDPLLGGLAGAAVTLWFTFVPCFLWIFAGAPYVETVRGIAWLKAALAAVSAAVVGVIANLTFWFALHVLFAEVDRVELGPLQVPVPALDSFVPGAAVIAVLAGVALLRFRLDMMLVLAACAALGVGLG